jgi:hypothetical protein
VRHATSLKVLNYQNAQMEDNIDKETLDNWQKSQPEIHLEESVATDSTSTIAGNKETKEMEVHHHPHVEKKDFKEYLLEGLMIFVAVMMGYIAENIREGIVKREREEQLMVMMVEDLKSDVKRLDKVSEANIAKLAKLDTLRHLVYASVHTHLPDSSIKYMYYLFRLYGGSNIFFQPTNRTLAQLDKSDAYALIRKQDVSDSIVNYRIGTKTLLKQDEVFNNKFQADAFDVGQTIFNGELLESFLNRSDTSAFLHSTQHFDLFSHDKQTLHLYGMKLFSTRAVLLNYITQLQWQKERANRLDSVIKKEYNLDEK